MEDSQNQPIYWDKHRIPVNITIIFSLVVVVFGIVQVTQGMAGNISPEILIIMGLLVGAYSWLTTPKIYAIYPDALIVAYGRPRRKVIYFNDISEVDMRQRHAPDRLRVIQSNGKRVAIVAKDPETFHEQLESALVSFRGGQTISSNGHVSEPQSNDDSNNTQVNEQVNETSVESEPYNDPNDFHDKG
ncbi:MAG: hypothetical protein CL886_09725 [Dehalococcoidia bacterium]|nr:hypothetical protein [Dehalococcoidia bacterium]|tara:strand:+ start:1887 stop:2450 length:564 start_codon:yes stop_codon:yes gene_type:complete